MVCSSGARIEAVSAGSSEGEATDSCGPHSLQPARIVATMVAAKAVIRRWRIVFLQFARLGLAVSAAQPGAQHVIADDRTAARERGGGLFELVGEAGHHVELMKISAAAQQLFRQR